MYILFSHFRPRDVTLGKTFFQMSSYAREYVRITYENPLRTSRGLKWENKTYKLKRSIEKSEWVLVYNLIGWKTVNKFTFLRIREDCILILVLLYKFI